MSHKWKLIKQTSYSKEYRCEKCSEYHEIHIDLDNSCIEFPPVARCSEDKKVK